MWHSLNKFLLAILPVIISFQSFGQNSMIAGSALRIEDDIPASGIKIYLIDSSSVNLDSTYTNENGLFSFGKLTSGNYSIKVIDIEVIVFENIPIEAQDSIDLEVRTYKPCLSNPNDSICSVCNRNDKTLPIEPSYIVSYTFKNERQSRRAWKKVKKRGYGIEDIEGSKSIIHPFFIESEEDKFENPCYNWFCVRDKYIF